MATNPQRVWKCMLFHSQCLLYFSFVFVYIFYVVFILLQTFPKSITKCYYCVLSSIQVARHYLDKSAKAVQLWPLVINDWVVCSFKFTHAVPLLKNSHLDSINFYLYTFLLKFLITHSHPLSFLLVLLAQIFL